MATAPSSSEGLSVATWATAPAEQATKSDRYLARRLAEASADFKTVAFTTFLLAASVAVAVWLICGVLLEHWLVAGGLPLWARWTWLGLGLTALAIAVVRWLVPLLRYRVNLVYAARALEAEHPELHNDLVNTVLVKARGDETAGAVLRSLERRTARRLSRLPNDGTVDRSAAVRLAVALVLVVAAASLYEISAPKSLLQSAARLLAPWSGITAPARVRIESPLLAWRQPGAGAAVEDDPARRLEQAGGSATLVRGRQLVITSGIRGLADGERAVVVVTTARDDGGVDPAARPWRVDMKPTGKDGRYRAVLPDPGRGLDHGVEFFIVAGDAQSERVRVAVVDTPSLLVREVRYDHPAYTGLGSDTVAWQGDLRAVEGTRVTITAEGNRPLKSAWIDLECDGKPDKELRVAPHDLARAMGTIELRLNAERNGPAHGSYRLVFTPRAAAGAAREETVIEKLEHRIEVLPDLPPEVSIEEPSEMTVAVPPAAPVTIRVRALDPDFGLARVTLETRLREGAAGQVVPLFDAASPPGSSPMDRGRGAFAGAVQLVPERLGAGPGSVLEYRAVATDTRPQEPNVQATPWQKLRIDPSAPPRQPEVPPPAERAGDDRDPAGKPDQQDSGKQDSGKQDSGKQDSGKQDGGKQDGGKQDGGKQDGGGEGRGDSGKGGEAAGQNPGDGDRTSPAGAGEKGAGEKGAGEKGAGEKGAGEKGGGEKGGGEKGGGEKGGGEKGGGEKGGGEKGGGEKGAGSGDNGGGDKSEPAARGEGRSEKQAGNNNENAGQAEPRNQQAGEQRGGEERRGEQRSGEQRQAEGSEQAGAKQRRDGAVKDDPQSGRPEPRETVAADGSNDGEALERILEERSKEEKRQGQGSEQQADEKSAANKPSDDGDQAREPGQSREPREDAASDQTQCLGADGEPCGKEGCSSCQGGKAGGGTSASGKPGAGKSGEGQPGQQNQGNQGQPDSGQQGQGQQGQGQQGQGQQGQGQQGQGQQGQGQQGQGGQPGDGQPGGGQPSQQVGGDAQRGGNEPAGSERGGNERAPGAGDQSAVAPVAGGDKQAGDKGNNEAGGEQAGGKQTDARATDGRPGGPVADGGADPSADDAGQRDAGKGGEAAGSNAAGTLGGRGGRPADDGPVKPREMEWTDQDLEHARNAADLAIEHLKRSLSDGRSDVLDALGWTPEQAQAFLDRWHTLRQMSTSDDPRQRGEFEQTLRSLGLRPGGVKTSRDVPADAKGGQAEGRRGRPPASYREQFQAFLRGTGGE
jgi:hypothetical protein